MKKIIAMIVLTTAVIIGLAGCGGNSDSNDEKKKEKKEKVYHAIGDSVEFQRDSAAVDDHMEFTVNSAEIVHEFNGLTPEEDQFLLVNITIKDLSGDNYNYDDFHIPSMTYPKGKGRSYSRVKDDAATVVEELDNGVTNFEVIYDVPEYKEYEISFPDSDRFLLDVGE